MYPSFHAVVYPLYHPSKIAMLATVGPGGAGDDDDGEENPASNDPAEDSKEDSNEDDGAMPRQSFRAFQTRVRADAAKRAEGNRCAGGLRTQRAMVRAWEVRAIFAC